MEGEMIYENAYLWITQGKEKEFEQAFERGRPVLASANGCTSVHLFRDVETSSAYLLRVGWEKLEDHVEIFPNSEQAGQFANLIEGYFAREPILRHFDSVDVAEMGCR
jgi:heme-degrading monooxygenase HmoA